jgi:hypothetical protein
MLIPIRQDAGHPGADEAEKGGARLNSPSAKLRTRPALFRALGHEEPPRVITINGEEHELVEVFKHDSWAATALYRGPRAMIVAKFNRQQPLFFVPMKWLGRWLARREARAWRFLCGVAGVPSDAGAVWAVGRCWRSAIAHPYIDGHPLHIDEKPANNFFSRLGEMLRAMHERGLAYVDLNKRENIIVSNDGAPALVDFQLHFAPPRWALRLPPVRWLFRELQAGDLYHLHKHIAWHRPDLLPVSERDWSRLQPRSGRIWRALYVRPMQVFRRRLLVWLRIRDGAGLAVSELDPEKAARLALERKAADPAARLPGES